MHNAKRLPKVALVYDWIDTKYGGAEKVLQAFHQAFPSAPLFTSVAMPDKVSWVGDLQLKTSFLQKWAVWGRKPRYLLPLLPLAFESLELDSYDVVISITSAFAKGIITKPNQVHLSYLLTPPRYLYSHQTEYLGEKSRFGWLKLIATPLLQYLKWWDQVAAHRPDKIIPISHLIASRAKAYYGIVTTAPIYPPIEALADLPLTVDERTMLDLLPGKYAVVVSRLVGYKRIDLAIQACQRQKIPLVIIGNGQEKSRLKELANGAKDIKFWGEQPQAVVNAAVRGAHVLLMPGIEDFGLTAAEAVASGIPAIVHRESGVAELLKDGQSSWFLDELSVDNVSLCLEKATHHQFQSEHLRKSMRKYATTTFVQQMQDLVRNQEKN